MIASPVSPSASKSPKTRTRSPPAAPASSRSRSRSASGRRRGSWRPSPDRRHEGRELGRVGDPARGEERATRRSENPAPAAGRHEVGVRVDEDAGDASESAARSRRQDAMPRCTRRYPARPGHGRRPARGPARGRELGAPARSSRFCQTTRSGLALKIDEYVPDTIPMSRARTK